MHGILIQAGKIMLGSSVAMVIAMHLNLEFATSAGIIALLTILTTKLETLRLSLYRIITYGVTVLLSWMVFQHIDSVWLAYGIFIFVVVFCSELVGWRPTVSVNAVIGTHFLSTRDFSLNFVVNEFMLVLIGISMAIVLNIFSRNNYSENKLIHNMKYTELKLQCLLEELKKYLDGKKPDVDLWKEIKDLEIQIEHFIEQSCEYNNNTFKKEGDYYEHYFEMRMMQTSILHNLHYELNRMKVMPAEAKVVSDYITELKVHILELNNPRKQIDELKVIIEEILTQELPNSREVLEGRVKIYHLLMDLEEFLVLKMRFVESVSSSNRYKKDYHNQCNYKIEIEKSSKENYSKKILKKQK
ncbi:MAG: aromatic acid exporter family protein [Eubacteriales bacterium]